MDLVLDAGNSRLKLGHFTEGALNAVFVFEQELDLLHHLEQLPETGKMIYANVGPWNLVDLLSQYKDVQELSMETPLPYTIAYTTPETLGHDRRALAAAAHREFPGRDVLVMDAGTCLTFDFINAEAQYLGGAISPGLNMRYRALRQYTAGLPELTPLKQKPSLTGDSTVHCMHSGVLYGLAGEVDGQIDRYREKYPQLVTVVTGGDAPSLVQLTKNDIFARPNFLLSGLYHILEYNA